MLADMKKVAGLDACCKKNTLQLKIKDKYSITKITEVKPFEFASVLLPVI